MSLFNNFKKAKAEFDSAWGGRDTIEKAFLYWEEAYKELSFLRMHTDQRAGKIKAELYYIEVYRQAFYNYLTSFYNTPAQQQKGAPDPNPNLTSRIERVGGIFDEEGFRIALQVMQADRKQRQDLNPENRNDIVKYARSGVDPWKFTMEDLPHSPSYEELKRWVQLRGIRSWRDYDDAKKPWMYPSGGIAPYRNLTNSGPAIMPSTHYPHSWVSEDDFFGITI